MKTLVLVLALISGPAFADTATYSIVTLPSPAEQMDGVMRILPNPMMTPGVVRPEITFANLCPKFVDPAANGVQGTEQYRNVPTARAASVYAEYGLSGDHHGYCSGPRGCEIDHLISIELGGANDPGNLWPQPYSGTMWTAEAKDDLENKLHTLVCARTITLVQAQTAIRTNWINAYKTYIGPAPVEKVKH